MKILHLYSDLLDLYGDVFNIRLIKQKSMQMGVECEIINKTIGDDVDFADYDMIYIGHGKGRNVAAASDDFCARGAEFIKAVEDGKFCLITGNARQLLGKSFESWDGGTKNGIGLFDYTAVETREVYCCDVVSTSVFSSKTKCFGFINRTAHLIGENAHPLFNVLKGSGDDTESKQEGNHYKNLYATWQMGPLLARNPFLLKIVLKELLGEKYSEFDTTIEDEALRITLSEYDV